MHVRWNLGRTLSWTDEGIRWRHSTKLVESALKEFGMVECNVVSTPMTNDDYKPELLSEDRTPMTTSEARRYRSVAAKINYLSQDRPDLGPTSCGLARHMACPREGDEVRLKRALRYLRGHPIMDIVYGWQLSEDAQQVKLWTDSDWATCKLTRKSCSGGVLMLGWHLVEFWCRLQERVAPSSGVAELYSANRGLKHLAGLINHLSEIINGDYGVGHRVHHVDATAARGILLRKGVGDLKHLEIRDLFGQELVRRLGVQVLHVPRDVNPADLLTSATAHAPMIRFLRLMGVDPLESEAAG